LERNKEEEEYWDVQPEREQREREQREREQRERVLFCFFVHFTCLTVFQCLEGRK
jgi:hypothetical protein